MTVTLNLWVLNLLSFTKDLPSHFPKQHWKNIRLFLLVTLDLLCVAISYYLSFVFRVDSFTLDGYFQTFRVSLLIYLLVHPFALIGLGLYKQVWRYANFNSGVLIARCTLVATFLSALVCYILPLETTPPRSIPFIFWFISTALIAFVKFSWRGLNTIKSLADESTKSRCFIYGAGSSGELLARYIKANPKFAYRVIGFIDDDPYKYRQLIHGKSILGSGRDLVRLAKTHSVDSVLIAMNSAPGKTIRGIVANCYANDLRPLILPEIAESMNSDVFKPRKVDVADLLRRSPKSIDKSKIHEFISNRTVLITGAGGSIGSEICRQVAKAEPALILILDMCEYNLYKIEDEIKKIKSDKTSLVILMGSITDQVFVENVFKKHLPEVVFHAAAYKHVPLVESNSIPSITNNVYGTRIVAEAADKYGAKTFLLISSDKAVNPVGVMGQTKRVCELIIQSINNNPNATCRYCAVRFGNVLGSSGSVIPKFMEQIASGGPVTVTDPNMTRYFMLVQEAVELVLQSITMTRGGEIFVLNMGDSVNIYEMAKQLIVLAGKRVWDDIDIIFTGIREGEKLYEELIYDGYEERTEHDDIFITKSKMVDREFIEVMCRKLLKSCAEHNEAAARETLLDLCSDKPHRTSESTDVFITKEIEYACNTTTYEKQ